LRTRRPSGVLVLLDGDVDLPAKEPFCPGKLGRDIAGIAKEEGGGTMFSLASVFALQEYESWLIAGIESLSGRPLPDGRSGVRAGVAAPERDLEAHPRDAKGWLRKHMDAPYKPTSHQGPLTKLLIEQSFPTRLTDMPSFQRLLRAVTELVGAMQAGRHIVTPTKPAPPGTGQPADNPAS
jgi:hypothetical protein